jgi:hypothetical protein
MRFTGSAMHLQVKLHFQPSNHQLMLATLQTQFSYFFFFLLVISFIQMLATINMANVQAPFGVSLLHPVLIIQGYNQKYMKYIQPKINISTLMVFCYQRRRRRNTISI